MKTKIAKVKREALLIVDLNGLDKDRALCALSEMEGKYKTDYFILRDMVEKEHEPHVYFTNGFSSYSHQLKDGKVTIFVEKYELEDVEQNVETE